jgi:hypothetical protein
VGRRMKPEIKDTDIIIRQVPVALPILRREERK